jgi:hypothetical protein
VRLSTVLSILALLCAPLFAQRAWVRDAESAKMPGEVDSNSPAYWKDGSLQLLNSTGNGPVRSTGADQFQLGSPQLLHVNRINQWPLWIEAVWPEANGVVLAWYHQEHWGVCAGSRLAVPQLGAAISYDGGNTYQDMGAILSSGDPYNCAAQNGYFAGGNGDVSVMLDREKKYFYFFFTNYAGPLETQGVAVARMPYSARYYPVGNVSKYYNGAWNEPGLRGRTTPVFPAKASWMAADTNSFWGPSIHWNTYLDSYVVLLNHSCCTPDFPQDGIYVSFGAKLDDPTSWTKPKKILADTGWYPQVLGTGPQGTDKQAGRVARLYIYGFSRWEIVFDKPDPPPAAQ